jgi:hypothetical protein
MNIATRTAAISAGALPVAPTTADALERRASATILSGLATGAAVEANPDAELLRLVDDYVAAFAETDRLCTVAGRYEEEWFDRFLQGCADNTRQQVPGLLDAERARDEQTTRWCSLGRQLEKMPARTLLGCLAKARAVAVHYPPGRKAEPRCSDFEETIGASVLNDLMALAGTSLPPGNPDAPLLALGRNLYEAWEREKAGYKKWGYDERLRATSECQTPWSAAQNW